MWLGRFDSPLPLRCRGAFHVYSARQGDEPVVVVLPGDPLPSPDAIRCVERLGAAHRLLDGPGIARFREAARFEATAFVSFSCDAACDGEAIIAMLGDTGARVSYPEAMAAVDRITGALAAAHDVVDAATQRPLALGAFSWANVLITRDGDLQVFGFGHNPAAFTESGGLSGAPAVFVAPEVAAGGPPTPSSDVYAFVVMQRSIMAFADVPGEVLRAFAGGEEEGGADATVSLAIRWINEHVLTAVPARRATMREAREVFAREQAALSLPPSYDGLRARLAAAVADDEAPRVDAAPRDPSTEFTVCHDGSWLHAPDGETYRVDRRPVRRLLLSLVRRRRDAPGEALDPDALLEIGWPGEHPIREAGLNRVYGALSLLRKMGLRDILQREEKGYRLDPSVPVEISLG